MKNAFIAAALTTALFAQTASANEEVNKTEVFKDKATAGEISLAWNVQHNTCSKDKYLVTMISNGSLLIGGPSGLTPENVSQIPVIYARTEAQATGKWLDLSVKDSTATEIGAGNSKIIHDENYYKTITELGIQWQAFRNALQDELGIAVIGKSTHFKVTGISSAPSPVCE